ncbi:MAG: DUF2723 domain-containing protein [Bacteroidales bacterium]|jgi:MFS family permease|nr:DUF2723 domain-containing protein [Bacteroidales bacterium]
MFKKVNNIIGWLIFAIATLVYLLTVEPSAGWWDVGEYIATSYKLQVGHPPGAPMFQLMGRFFSLFAFGNVENVALMINIMSVFSSSFTILFLFWTITRLARKLVANPENNQALFPIMVSGIVGALAYTFSDSFWFSAVEGEVYAMSSLFTAIVFWAILKWEEVADSNYSYRWLILIAFLIGLSIGVHLLNLLAIPAITYVVYFKKFKKTDWKGFVLAGLVSLFVLSFVMYFIIPITVKLAGAFELFFINVIGLPFNTGSILFFISVIAVIVWAIRFTHKKKQLIAHIAILSTTFILIGYSSFLILVIRANANPPINENDPKDAISMLSYLLREQYGTWPLLYGQYYNADVASWNDKSPTYVKDEAKGKYIITDSGKDSAPIYNPKLSGLFPRMWSNQKPQHIEMYKSYQNSRGTPVKITDRDGNDKIVYKPSFGDNLRFFFSYQVGHMYFRYFMWNFAGRQNDIESQPNIRNGNWISGINFIDSLRLGNQNHLPIQSQNPANNKFYFLPFILGLIGLIYQLNRNNKDFWVVLLLFIMTGLAIVVYLNNTPYQPRERDYAYAGSFYAFAIWIGLGLLPLINLLKNKIGLKVSSIIVGLATLILVPGLMASEGWDDHNRSGKTTARDFAYNYLSSCEPNAVLFVNGDNDTFPLWYIQEVEGFRTDVRVVNYMLSSGSWYVHQMGRKLYDSKKIPLSLTQDKYNNGINDYVPITERLEGTHELKAVIDFIKSDHPSSKVKMTSGSDINYMPTRNIKLALDKAKLLSTGTVSKDKIDKVPDSLTWRVSGSFLQKNDLMLLDFLSSNNWDRPIYFANPSSVKKVLGLDEYMHLEGFVYRLRPYKAEGYMKNMGGIDADKSFDLLVNKAKYGNLEKDEVSVDRESYRNSRIPQNNLLRVAEALLDRADILALEDAITNAAQIEERTNKAVQALDTYVHYFPNHKIHWNMYMLTYAENYMRAGEMDKATDIIDALYIYYISDLDYINSQRPVFRDLLRSDQQTALGVLQRMGQYTKKYGLQDLSAKIDSAFTTQIEFY